jgi:hypothetical protein
VVAVAAEGEAVAGEATVRAELHARTRRPAARATPIEEAG